jgi:hypothetical protein
MWKKALLNFLCNLGIFVCALAVYYGFGIKHYELAAAGAFGAIVLVGLKVRLMRAVRDATKKP